MAVVALNDLLPANIMVYSLVFTRVGAMTMNLQSAKR